MLDAVSRHKFASNVCEKALFNTRGQLLRDLISELIDIRPDGSNNVRMLLQDAFGNFPLQVSHFFKTSRRDSPRETSHMTVANAIVDSIEVCRAGPT